MVLGRNGLRALVALTRPAALFVFLLLLAGHSFAGNAVLTWDPVVANPAVTGLQGSPRPCRWQLHHVDRRRQRHFVYRTESHRGRHLPLRRDRV